MNTKTMENLLMVAEEKSVSKAAELLYMSQPTLSHCIQSAERELGFKLFHFSKGQMNLTDAGIVYINGVKAILAEKASLDQKLAELRDDTKQRVRLIILPDEYFFISKCIFPRFQEVNPDAALMVMQSPPELASEYLLSGLADLALTTSSVTARYALASRVLYRDEVVLAVPRSMDPEAAPERVLMDLSAFADQCFFLTIPDGHRSLVETSILRHYGFVPRSIREVNSQWTALQMVIGGHGVAFLARSIVEMYPKDVNILSLEPPHFFEHCAAFPRDAKLARVVRSLLDIMEEEYKKIDNYLPEQRQNWSPASDVHLPPHP